MTQTTISWLRPKCTYATISCAARPQEGICNLFLPPVAQVETNSAELQHPEPWEGFATLHHLVP